MSAFLRSIPIIEDRRGEDSSPDGARWRTLLIAALAGMLAFALVAAATVALARGATTEARVDLGAAVVSVVYERTTLDGIPLDQAVPPGNTWPVNTVRAVKFTTSADLLVGDIAVSAGAYSAFVRRSPDATWEIVLNGIADRFAGRIDEESNVVSIPVQWSHSAWEEPHLLIELAPGYDEITETVGVEMRLVTGSDELSVAFAVVAQQEEGS